MISNEKTVDILKNIVETTRDGQKGFNECMEKCESPELKSLFSRAAARCQEGINDLEQLIRQYGGEPETEGSLLGSLHRGWMDLRTALSSNDDKVVLEECERGEDVALKNYDEALQADLPSEVAALLRKQQQGVRANHDQIRALRDAMA